VVSSEQSRGLDTTAPAHLRAGGAFAGDFAAGVASGGVALVVSGYKSHSAG
jgi:hypothetical protein